MDIIVSGTESLINGYGKQSVHDLGSIKAIFPPLNYGGEPSVSTGIGSQLPSSHLSIHRVLAKLSDGIISHGVNYCQLQFLFLWIITAPFPVWRCSLSADALPLGALLALVWMRPHPKPHHNRVSVPRMRNCRFCCLKQPVP